MGHRLHRDLLTQHFDFGFFGTCKEYATKACLT